MNYKFVSEVTRYSANFNPAVSVPLSSLVLQQMKKGGTAMADQKAPVDAIGKFLMLVWRLQLPVGETTYLRQLNYRQALILWEVIVAQKTGKGHVSFQDLIVKYGVPDYSLTKDCQSLREGDSFREFSDANKHLNKGAGWLNINRDGRNKIIVLTKKGKQIADEVWKAISN